MRGWPRCPVCHGTGYDNGNDCLICEDRLVSQHLDDMEARAAERDAEEDARVDEWRTQ